MLQWLLIVVSALVAGLAVLLLAFVLGMRAKSPFVLGAVKRFNRRFVNPAQMKTAGTPGAYAGVIRHVGRRTGRLYETPVGPFPTDDGFVIALPYGTSSDWVKNVLAAGSATLVTEGQTYEVDRPAVVSLGDVDRCPAEQGATEPPPLPCRAGAAIASESSRVRVELARGYGTQPGSSDACLIQLATSSSSSWSSSWMSR